MTDLTGLEADVVELLTGVYVISEDDYDPADERADFLGRLAAWRDAAVAGERDKTERPSRAWHADWAEVDRDQGGNAILRHKPTGGMYKILPVEEC